MRPTLLLRFGIGHRPLALLSMVLLTGCGQSSTSSGEPPARIETDLPTMDVQAVPFEDRYVFDAGTPHVTATASPRSEPPLPGSAASRERRVVRNAPTSVGSIETLPTDPTDTSSEDDSLIRSMATPELGGPTVPDQVLTAQGKAALDAGHYDEAVTLLYRATSLNPRNSIAYHLLGMTFTARNEPGKAVSNFDAAIQLDPKVSASYLYRGISHVKLQQNSHAIEDLDEAVRMEPKLAAVYIWRTIAHLNLRHPKEATADAERAVSLDEKSPDAYFVRSLARMQSGRLDDGRKDFNYAISLGLDENSRKLGRKYFPGK